MPSVYFNTPWKHLENLWFSDVFRGYRKGLVAWYGLRWIITAWKVSKYGVISGPYIPAFGMNTERYELSLRIQSECGKIRLEITRYLDSVFGLCHEIVKAKSKREMCQWNIENLTDN